MSQLYTSQPTVNRLLTIFSSLFPAATRPTRHLLAWLLIAQLALESASQYMFPVGTIIPYAGDLSKIPYGWHVCDGTSGTPDLSDRFLEGTTTASKTFKDAGLPNIIGDIHGDVSGKTYDDIEPFSIADSWNTYGALSVYDIHNDYRTIHPNSNEDAWSTYGMHFDASKSNSIYGASETVQPKSYTVYYIMRVM